MDDAPSGLNSARVQKILANAGIGSRRYCEELILAGRVSVNGEVVRLGSKADRELDLIEVDGVRIPTSGTSCYVLLNKPKGVVSTVSDPEGRPTVVDLVTSEKRLFPVGRLDAATGGLIILTNDGDLANLLMHPSTGVEKVYVVEVIGQLDRKALGRLRGGIELEDGLTSPARVEVKGIHRERMLLEMTIHEGRNRQIRRMIEAVGGRVVKLSRVAIGPLRDRNLQPGEWRYLRPVEISRLYASAQKSDTRPR